MNNDHFTPEEQALIDLLQKAPQPRLSARAMESIRQQMMTELISPAAPAAGASGTALSGLSHFMPGLAAVSAVVLVVAVAGLLLAGSMQGGPDDPAPQTSAALESSAAPTETPTPTDTPLPTDTPTETPAPTNTPTETPSPTDTPLPTDTPTETPAPTDTPTAAADEDPIIVVEGPVERIDGDTITIYGLDFQLPPGHPLLNIMDLGDYLRIEGAVSSENILIATLVSNMDGAAPASVGLDGLVEAIEDNIVTVNDIEVALDPQDPLLRTLRVGDFLSVEGNFELRENRYLLVVVYVQVIAPAGAGIPPNCYYHETGMGMGMGMGHWRCDDGMGMGMGMEGMGGMGMGSP